MNKVYTRLSLQSHVFVVSTQSNIPTVFGKGVSRETITKFSKSSQARLKRYLRCCTAEYNVMLTLTYPHSYPKDGKVFKEHLRRFVQDLKRKDKACPHSRNGHGDWSCFWFMEFQERGAAHFHLFITRPYPKVWIADRWFNIVGSDDMRHKYAGTRIEKIRSGRRGTTSYASKYASKSEQKVIPEWVKNAGRFWGVSGQREAVAADILLDVAEVGHPALEKKLSILRDILENGIKTKQIGRFQKGSTVVFYMRNDLIVKEVMKALIMVELYVFASPNSMRLEFPHHEIGGASGADSLHS